MKKVLSLALFASVSLGSLAQAGSVSGTVPGSNPGNNVTYSFEDTITTASLALSGKIEFDDNISSMVIQTPDGFWKATLALTLDEYVDDELYLSVTLQHTSEPHPGHDHGNGTVFSDSFTVLAENFTDGDWTISHDDVVLPHGEHDNRFYNNKFTFTKTTAGTGILDFDEIPTWNYTLNGVHIPEPASMSLLALGLGSLFVGRRRRQA